MPFLRNRMVNGPAQLDCNPENRALAVPVARKRHDSMEVRFSCGLSSRVQGPEDFASRGTSAASLAFFGLEPDRESTGITNATESEAGRASAANAKLEASKPGRGLDGT